MDRRIHLSEPVNIVASIVLSGGVEMGRDARQELDAGLQVGAAATGASNPDDACGDHLAAIGQALTPSAQADVNAESLSRTDGRPEGHFDAQAGGADVLGLAAEVPADAGFEDFHRAVLSNPKSAPPFGAVACFDVGVVRHCVTEQQHKNS